MHDQVEALHARGIAAAQLGSNQTRNDQAGVASGKDVDHLFLAGGAARVPKLSKTLSSLVRACSLGSPPVFFCFLCF